MVSYLQGEIPSPETKSGQKTAVIEALLLRERTWLGDSLDLSFPL